jgi:hypothetical protein
VDGKFKAVSGDMQLARRNSEENLKVKDKLGEL